MDDAIEPFDYCDLCGEGIYDEQNDSGICDWCERESYFDDAEPENT